LITIKGQFSNPYYKTYDTISSSLLVCNYELTGRCSVPSWWPHREVPKGREISDLQWKNVDTLL